MKNLKNKSKISAIAFVILLTFAAIIVALPIASAHDPAWDVPMYAFVNIAPDPVGVNQPIFVVFWLDKVMPTAAGTGGYRWSDMTLEITTPDGSVDTLGPFMSDPVASAYTQYTPSQIGTYTVKFIFPEQVLTLYNPVTGEAGSNSPYIGDTYLATTATTTFTAQEEPIAYFPDTPLPRSYWERPIEAQNTAWASLASNWLGQNLYSTDMLRWQRDGVAPNTAHVIWTKPYSFGGFVGGSNPEYKTFYSGTAYEFKFQDPIIMYGNLYYEHPLANNINGGGVSCINLRTGEQLWYNPDISLVSTGFGQLYNYESRNQHGTIPNGYLWSVSRSTWTAYDPFAGALLFTIENVPGGTQKIGPNGEMIKYNIWQENNTSPYTRITLWNNTAIPELLASPTSPVGREEWRPVGKTVDGSTGYSWNVSLSEPIPDGSSIRTVIVGDFMFGQSSGLGNAGSTGFGAPGTVDPYTLWAVSLKPETLGQVMWIKDYPAPAGNLTTMMGWADDVTRTFTMYYKETMQWTGYSLDTGAKIWGPTAGESAFNYYGGTTGLTTAFGKAYGNLYVAGYGGLLYCYDLETGNLDFVFGNDANDPLNSTSSGLETVYGHYPHQIGAIADGKVYLVVSEHSMDSPPYKGAKVVCVDAYTGQEVWSMYGQSQWQSSALADGYFVYLNYYDMQIYCVGPGPSATTVTAAPKVTAWGSSVLIEGTVTDQSPDVKGTPAIADEDQGEWMQYLRMQKPCPADAQGVEVVLTTLDPNGNSYEIGRVTSDTAGMYKLLWEPPVPGEYTIIATFEGSDSYGPSFAETAIGVTEAPAPAATIEPEQPAAPAPTEPTPTEPEPITSEQTEPTTSEPTTPEPTEPTTEAPLITTEIAIIAVVAVACVIGIVAFWALRKRK